MDFTQRLKWIEQVMNAEKTDYLQSPSENRILGMQDSTESQVQLPLKHISLFERQMYL